jgi:hypothetical protein
MGIQLWDDRAIHKHFEKEAAKVLRQAMHPLLGFRTYSGGHKNQAEHEEANAMNEAYDIEKSTPAATSDKPTGRL